MNQAVKHRVNYDEMMAVFSEAATRSIRNDMVRGVNPFEIRVEIVKLWVEEDKFFNVVKEWVNWRVANNQKFARCKQHNLHSSPMEISNQLIESFRNWFNS